MHKHQSSRTTPSSERFSADHAVAAPAPPYMQTHQASQPIPDPSLRSRASGVLRKPAPGPVHSRNTSGQYLDPNDAPQPNLEELRRSFAEDLGFNRPGPLAPPQPVFAGSHSRSPSGDRSRSSTPTKRSVAPAAVMTKHKPRAHQHTSSQTKLTPEKDKKKHGWFGKSKDKKGDGREPLAWIAGHPQHLPYDIDSLWSGSLMPELSDDDDANCYVHLWSANSGRGPSFKVDSSIFAASPVLTKLAYGELFSSTAVQYGGDRREVPIDTYGTGPRLSDTPPASPRRRGPLNGVQSSPQRSPRVSNGSDGSQPCHIFLPLVFTPEALATPELPNSPSQTLFEDVQGIVDVRNAFAFLCGQSLVATPRKHSFFHIFMTIASILRAHEFTNIDGSTFGEVASASFDSYVEELGLADVRTSREKTIEGIVLGERMKSVLLYNEAFTHAAGKYEELMALKSPKWDLISPITLNRLARASMDLEKRVDSIRLILTDFDFPALFSGIMNSKVSEERKEGVKFEGWKDSFLGMRKFVMGLYSHRYGHWPPKAKSKKNDLETSGLNRKVLRDVYHDMSSMYDLLVDRNHLTTRTVDGLDLGANKEEPIIRALRAVLSEDDRSSPPVKPPIPFDLPRLPLITTTRPDFGRDVKNDSKAVGKKLRDDEIARILRASWNDDALVTPFVNAFRDHEAHAAHNSNINQICDQRLGHWIFMYVVLQALPMLACDAPDLKHTSGVEYFLCEPPRGGVPWATTASAGGAGASGSQRRWFSVGEGGGVVNLPSDVIEHSVEGIYRRSHCWIMAEKWTASNPIINAALHEQERMNAAQSAVINEHLPPPPSTVTGLLPPGSRSSSPQRVSNRSSFIGLGLEALPLPPGVSPDGRSSSVGDRRSWAPGSSMPGSRPETPVHAVDTSKTFDSILGGIDQDQGVKKGKKK